MEYITSNLDLSIRINQKIIVRNNRMNGTYGIEETYGECPMKLGYDFEIQIVADKTMFRIIVNGYSFADFFHRIPLTDAKYLSVNGDLSAFAWRKECADHSKNIINSISFKDKLLLCCFFLSRRLVRI